MALLRQLFWPLCPMLLAAFFEYFKQDLPRIARFFAWLFMAAWTVLWLVEVESVMRIKDALLDATGLVTLAWLVLLFSTLWAAFLWNVVPWETSWLILDAFVYISHRLWVMTGMLLIANIVLRLAYSLREAVPAARKLTVLRLQQLLGSPPSTAANPQMANANSMMLNMIAIRFMPSALAAFSPFSSWAAPWVASRHSQGDPGDNGRERWRLYRHGSDFPLSHADTKDRTI